MTHRIILPDWLIAGGLDKPLRGWGIRVSGDKITELDTHDSLTQNYPHDEIWPAPGQALSPGFVNSHTHLYGVLAHGIPLHNAPEGFWPFLKDFWWPQVEDRLSHVMIRAAAHWQCALMLRSGVTSFYDCLEAPNTLPGCLNQIKEVVEGHGLRAILSFEATERISAENGQLGLRENENFIQECQITPGLVSGMMCFHTTFTCSEGLIRQAFDIAKRLNVSVHMHCSEGTYEPAYAEQKFGVRPIEYYRRLGVLGADMLASQCVHLNETEIALIAEYGGRVSHMPLSNCEVGGGIAPVPQMVAANIPLGLGSDSYIDDFFEVMRGAFLIHKAHQQDPRLMPANLVWHLATEGGAKALGLNNVGRIEPGWQADLQLIDLDFPTPVEEWNIFDQLLLYGNRDNVKAVFVAGEPLVKDGRLLRVDEKVARESCRRQARELWAYSDSNPLKSR
ncbi:MAG: amidohydrolase family protein [Anaerolineales bacterium]|nr:amidohydrolase family protein [Anaerolineales bacterium]